VSLRPVRLVPGGGRENIARPHGARKSNSTPATRTAAGVPGAEDACPPRGLFTPYAEPVDAPSDAQLIERILGGEREAYAILVDRYQEAMYRHAVGMVGDRDAASDLVQDSFVKAYTRLDTCQDPEKYAAWVFRILRNRCKDWLKNRRRRNVSLTEETASAPSGDDPGLTLERSELGRVVDDALGRLPEAQREAFLLKHVEGRSYEEMAEMLDTGVSALKMRVMRAREALQSLLRDIV
jgi:RNA polymerase sigma-70 factor, ECF subfamily